MDKMKEQKRRGIAVYFLPTFCRLHRPEKNIDSDLDPWLTLIDDAKKINTCQLKFSMFLTIHIFSNSNTDEVSAFIPRFNLWIIDLLSTLPVFYLAPFSFNAFASASANSFCAIISSSLAVPACSLNHSSVLQTGLALPSLCCWST